MSELFSSETLEVIKRYEENFQYFASNYDKLKEEHRGKYIAIDQGKVIVQDSDHSQLLEYLRQRFTDTRPIFIKYLSETDDTLMV
jgi:hypothetical protein